MVSGILCIISACFCWGLCFVLPAFIQGFHPVEIALARFFIYGLISFLIILLKKRHLFSKAHLGLWKKASYLSLLSTLLCYTGTLFNISYAGPTVATLVFAMAPITIALVGNWHTKESSAKKLFLPLALMMSGIFLAKFRGLDGPEDSLGLYLLGIFSGLVALGTWTWFAVVNSDFLKKNKDLSVDNWVLILGATTFFHVLIVGSFLFWGLEDKAKYFTLSSGTQKFFLFTALLGTVSTWIAFSLWNKGSKKISISLAGQLTIFEIIFALILIYIAEQKLPTSAELAGIVLMALGMLISFRQLKKKPSQETLST